MTESFSYPTDKYVLVGVICKAHGIRGELKVIPFSGEPARLSTYRSFVLVSENGSISRAVKVTKARSANRDVIISLEGITDRDKAEELTGYGLLVQKDDLPSLVKGEYYLHELEGVEVETDEGQPLGRVEAFFNNSIHDMLVVRDRKTKEEYLIPLVPGMISKRDKTSIVIKPPPGLLEINKKD